MTSRSVTLPPRSAPRRGAQRQLGVVLAAGGMLLCAGLLWRSFQRSTPGVMATSAAGRPLRWVPAEIILRPNSGTDEAFDTLLQTAFLKSAKSWNDALADCRVPKLRVVTGAHRSLRPLRDGFSTVLVRRDKWCPDSAREDTECYDADRAAFTSLYPNDAEGGRYGDVREADMEINAVNFTWSLEGEESGTSSLHAIVVHELGHVLGLDHPCEASVQIPGADHPKRRCDSPALRASIMYPLPIEADRPAVLEPGRGEREALCALYARTAPASMVAPVGSP